MLCFLSVPGRGAGPPPPPPRRGDLDELRSFLRAGERERDPRYLNKAQRSQKTATYKLKLAIINSGVNLYISNAVHSLLGLNMGLVTANASEHEFLQQQLIRLKRWVFYDLKISPHYFCTFQEVRVVGVVD